MPSLNFAKTNTPSSSRLTKATITIHALSAGHFTLPEYQFVHPVSREARKTVPSLAFLIQHHNGETDKTIRILFDLGLRDIKRYSPQIQKHMETRQPLTTDPDVVKSLARGGLTPSDIDYILYSHVHWDHIGQPLDFPSSFFIVGNGALALLSGSSPTLHGSHSFFEHDLLPLGRTIELSNPTSSLPGKYSIPSGPLHLHQPWKPYNNLPHTLDIFNDGSILIVSAPGHLPGHVNVLAQVSDTHRIYLGGDSYHDKRLMTGEKEIGQWTDAHGNTCCIHADRKAAEETIERIRELEKEGVEIIIAHDYEWENDSANHARFFGADSEE